jgi:hypothetical protein
MLPSSGIQHRVVRMWRDFSEQRILSIFRVPNHLLHVLSRSADFSPEDGDDMSLRNVSSRTDYTELYPRRW